MYKQKAQGLKLLVAEVEKQIAQTWFLLVPGDWHSILAEFSHLVPSLTVWQLQIHRNPDQDKAITEDYDYILFFSVILLYCVYMVLHPRMWTYSWLERAILSSYA